MNRSFPRPHELHAFRGELTPQSRSFGGDAGRLSLRNNDRGQAGLVTQAPETGRKRELHHGTAETPKQGQRLRALDSINHSYSWNRGASVPPVGRPAGAGGPIRRARAPLATDTRASGTRTLLGGGSSRRGTAVTTWTRFKGSPLPQGLVPVPARWILSRRATTVRQRAFAPPSFSATPRKAVGAMVPYPSFAFLGSGGPRRGWRVAQPKLH